MLYTKKYEKYMYKLNTLKGGIRLDNNYITLLQLPNKIGSNESEELMEDINGNLFVSRNILNPINETRFINNINMVHYYGYIINYNEIKLIFEYMNLGNLLYLYTLPDFYEKINEDILSVLIYRIINMFEISPLNSEFALHHIYLSLQGNQVYLKYLQDMTNIIFTNRESVNRIISENINFNFLSPQNLENIQTSPELNISWRIGIMIILFLTRINVNLIRKKNIIISMKIITNIDGYNNIVSTAFEDINISEELKDFINGCLQKDYKKRFNFEQIKNHPFMVQTPNKIDQFIQFIKELYNNHPVQIDLQILKLKKQIPSLPIEKLFKPYKVTLEYDISSYTNNIKFNMIKLINSLKEKLLYAENKETENEIMKMPEYDMIDNDIKEYILEYIYQNKHLILNLKFLQDKRIYNKNMLEELKKTDILINDNFFQKMIQFFK